MIIRTALSRPPRASSTDARPLRTVCGRHGSLVAAAGVAVAPSRHGWNRAGNCRVRGLRGRIAGACSRRPKPPPPRPSLGQPSTTCQTGSRSRSSASWVRASARCSPRHAARCRRRRGCHPCRPATMPGVPPKAEGLRLAQPSSSSSFLRIRSRVVSSNCPTFWSSSRRHSMACVGRPSASCCSALAS